MPSPRVQRREPLHHFCVLIGYDIVHIDDLVMTIVHVIVVDIRVTKRDRVRICCVLHDVSEVLAERGYAIDSYGGDTGGLWSSDQQG